MRKMSVENLAGLMHLAIVLPHAILRRLKANPASVRA